MPDKRNDEQFIDEAWNQMRAMLDQEMPEERKRRLVPVFWVVGAAASLLLLLTVGGILWQQQEKQAPVAVIKNADSTLSKWAAEDCEESTNNSTLVQQNAKIKQPNQGMFEKNNANFHSTITGDLKNEKPEHSNKVVNNGLAVNHNQNNVAAEIMSQVFDNKDVNSQNIKSNKNQNIIPFTPIHSLDLVMLEYQKPNDVAKQPLKPQYWYPLDPNEGSTPENAKQDNFKIGVEFATYSSTYAAVDGYAGGAVLDIPVQSKSLNLRAGVNFSAQQRYFDSNIPAGAGKSADPNVNNNPGFVGNNVVVDPNPELSVNAQQLSLPLTLQFKPRRTWGLEGGLQASYLLNAQNLKGAEAYQTLAGMTYGSQQVRTLVEGFSLDSSANNNSDKINLEQLRRFDVALTAGFGYYPTSSIGVRLQYQRGLIDMLKSNDFKAFGNNIRLSAVYFFGK